MPETTDTIHEQVRERYAGAALAVLEIEAASCCGGPSGASCCGDAMDTGRPSDDPPGFGATAYSPSELALVPGAAVAASLGCGNPIAIAQLNPGDTVLDLGSGGGIDVLLSASRVGPRGFAYGLDMTPEMLELARRNAAAAGATNVEFLRGTIEAIPLSDASVDVVVSNCVINLAADKDAVFTEIARVLRPGGRLAVSDIVAEDRLSSAERAERGDYAGCVAGALSFSEYETGLRRAGLVDVTVTPTQPAADGIHSAIVRARRPG